MLLVQSIICINVLFFGILSTSFETKYYKIKKAY